MTKIKAFFVWLYTWVTVVAGIVVGAFLSIASQLDLLLGIDFSSILPADRAAKIVAAIALTKAIAAMLVAAKTWWTNRKASKED